jgi:hypothetical protein
MKRNELLILTFLWIFPLRSSCSSWNIFSSLTAIERALMVELDGVVADFAVDIMADKEKQLRLAWHLSSCFQEDSGRPSLQSCCEASKMVHCREMLSDSESKVFLELFLETNILCHQLQYVFSPTSNCKLDAF